MSFFFALIYAGGMMRTWDTTGSFWRGIFWPIGVGEWIARAALNGEDG